MRMNHSAALAVGSCGWTTNQHRERTNVQFIILSVFRSGYFHCVITKYVLEPFLPPCSSLSCSRDWNSSIKYHWSIKHQPVMCYSWAGQQPTCWCCNLKGTKNKVDWWLILDAQWSSYQGETQVIRSQLKIHSTVLVTHHCIRLISMVEEERGKMKLNGTD